jgi:hypothetical protein
MLIIRAGGADAIWRGFLRAERHADFEDYLEGVVQVHGADAGKALQRLPEGILEPGPAREPLLLAMPEGDFIAAIEAQLRGIYRSEIHGINAILRENGVPYEVTDEGLFLWRGSDSVVSDSVERAAITLRASELEVPRQEFTAARRHLRFDDPKELEDAVEEAAKAVEGLMVEVLRARAAAVPGRPTWDSLFSALRAAGIVPASAKGVLQGPALIRNAEAAHTAATGRSLDRILAESAVALAAIAIRYLGHRLPPKSPDH